MIVGAGEGRELERTDILRPFFKLFLSFALEKLLGYRSGNDDYNFKRRVLPYPVKMMKQTSLLNFF